VAQSVELLDGVAEVPAQAWNALVAGGSPFLEWEWLASLEHAGCVSSESGWQPRPLVVREDDEIVAACPLYIKGHSEGEFVFDWGWADAAERAGIRYYPKLLVGVPFTPVTGARFLTGAARGRRRRERIRLLAHALRELCDGNEISGIHVNFCLDDEVDALDETPYQLRVGLQYHWRDAGYDTFDDYLGHLRSKRRNQVRRERRRVAEQGIRIEVLSGDEIDDALVDPMFRCYLATVRNHFYGRQYLNRGFFELLRERFRHRLCFVVARDGDEVVAGTINVAKDDALYGRYWGGLRHVPYLHFEVCYYAAIEYCIEHGLQRFEPGAGGDYKFLRGFDAQPTYSLHYLSDPRLADAISRYLERERDDAEHAIQSLHSASALKHAAPGPPGTPEENP
jgi:predicted N-acyltransferase